MIRSFAVAAAAWLALTALPASAQFVPGGSYQQSCTNVRVNGNRLHARCSASNGARIPSHLFLPCRGDIANANGHLRCNGFGGGNGGGFVGGRLPYGSYQGSCVNARMNGTMLSANCSAANGARIASSINVQFCRRGADIANRNGYLNCEL